MKKPLNRKSYGSIGHLPCSRLGPSDHKMPEGQAKIATTKARDKHDRIIIQEKLDGSNVGVCKVDGEIIALSRSGYTAISSPYEMHHRFDSWVKKNIDRFDLVLNEGERVCGEWLEVAHGTMYKLNHEPFVCFDIFTEENKRLPFDEFNEITKDLFIKPHLVSDGPPMSVEDVLSNLGVFGFHGALEQIEGAIWRVERKKEVDFLCKYVRPDKVDGKYLGENEIKNPAY